MQTQEYGDWSLEVHRRIGTKRIPVSGVIELTRRCNLRCLHCYTNLPADDRRVQAGELTAAEHCRLLDDITAAGCVWMLFTGGEILLRNDFLEIYTHAKKNGLLTTLFTNGTLITPRIADHLAEYLPFSIEITLYGRTRQTYERVAGVAGSFERCLAGIRLLQERQLPIQLKAMVMRTNVEEIWELKRYVEEDLGVEFRFDSMLNPRIDCSQRPLAVRLSPEQVVALDLMSAERISEWRRFHERFGGLSCPPENGQSLYRCGGGLQSFAVDPEGRLRMCVMSGRTGYDLCRGSFQAGWENFLLALRQQPITRRTKCAACGLQAMCGMCPANGELECGDPEAPVDFLCQVAHLRAYALGLPVPEHGECEYCEGGGGYEEMRARAESLKERHAWRGPEERPAWRGLEREVLSDE